MLPKPNRLPTSKFLNVLKRGRRINVPEMSVVYEKQDNNSRFGFVVSAKVSPKAVTRNRVKRLMRESVQHLLGRVVKGYDYVLIARSGIQNSSQKEVEKEIISLLQKAHLYIA